MGQVSLFSFLIFFLLILLAVLAALYFFYTFLMRLFARMSGYNRLAQRYATPYQPEGQEYRRQTLQIGAVRWRNCVRIGVSPLGLYLRPEAMLTSYAPVLIPWDEIRKTEGTRLYWRQAWRLSVGEPRVATITLPMDLFETIRPHLGPDLPQRLD